MKLKQGRRLRIFDAHSIFKNGKVIFMIEPISKYIVNVARQTRQHASVWVGAGPRATLALLSASRALAALEERDFVIPEDVKTLAVPVLEHRIVLRPEFEMEGVEIREVINAVLEAVEVPR